MSVAAAGDDGCSGHEDVCRLGLEGWITLELEDILRDAVSLANSGPGRYLDTVHVVAAVLARKHPVPALPVTLWSPGMSLAEWGSAIDDHIAETDARIANSNEGPGADIVMKFVRPEEGAD